MPQYHARLAMSVAVQEQAAVRTQSRDAMVPAGPSSQLQMSMLVLSIYSSRSSQGHKSWTLPQRCISTIVLLVLLAPHLLEVCHWSCLHDVDRPVLRS